MPGQFDLQANFPIQGVANLLADRTTKEAAMRAQQQQQLVQGLQQFGQGVQSLVDRRNKMAQALAGAQIYSQTPEGQQVLGNNQVTQTPMGPVTQNQTAAYDPATGSVTPNQSPVTTDTIAKALYGIAPKDLLDNQAQSRAADIQRGRLELEQKTEPQKIAMEGRKAAAEEENNRIQRLIQQMLANNTIRNQAQERTQAEEKSNQEAAKAIMAAGSPLNPFNPVTFAQKRAALNVLSPKVDHAAAIQWAKDNQNDPRAKTILDRATGS